MSLKTWDIFHVGDFYKFKERDNNLIIIDITKEPFVKQLGSITKDGEIKIIDTTIFKRNLTHRRCKTSVIIKGNSIYCPKCGHIIPNKDTGRWSYLANKFLKTKNIIIGEALVNNEENPIILIDQEYIRRKTNFKIKNI